MVERYLADENFPVAGVSLMRQLGFDVLFIAEMAPGTDETIGELAQDHQK